VSGQKLFGIGDLAEDVGIESAMDEAGTVSIEFAPDGHRSVFARSWLVGYATGGPGIDQRTEDAKALWSAPQLDLVALAGSWPRLRSESGHRERCLDRLLRLGFVRLSEVPVRPGAVLDVAAEFGFVRETNYGRVFDVRVTPAATNLASTSLPITPHTDNPYRDPVPTLQFLHCLVNEADGGDSGLVDGFWVAARLRELDPSAFAILTRTPVPFRYADGSTDLTASGPLIAVDPRGRIRGIRFNNRSMCALRLPVDEAARFYAAYRAFAALLVAPQAQVDFRLVPGDCVVFDDTRILHARTAFAADGRRHLQGCYADIDAVESQLRVIRRSTRDGR
jgi:gamma-butyrobetaine dioxygenase